MTDELKQQLHTFFPDEDFNDNKINEDLEKGEILVHRNDILPYLQTALIDDKVVEVELDGDSQIYFTRLKDDLPDPVEEVQDDGSIILVEPENYSEGDYLLSKKHLVTLPVEPGLGNFHLRNSHNLILRMFTNNFGIEMCTSFESQIKVRGLPVLRLKFPRLARIVRNAREYRTKVPDEMEFIATFELEDDKSLDTTVVNISRKGIAFSLNKEEQGLFVQDQELYCKLLIDEELLAMMKGRVIHHSKVRKQSRIEYLCGIEFDFETRTSSAVIESIVASVQRAHLKSLAEKSEESGINLIA